MKRVSLALGLGFLAAAVMAATADARTWTNKAGRQLEADYVGMEDGQVKLRIAKTGKVVTIPVETLSEADQKVIGDDLFSKKIREDSENADTYVDRGMAKLNRKEYDSALEDFNTALKLDRKNASAYDGRGQVYGAKGDAIEAHKEYDKALELNPNLASAFRNRGDNYKALAKAKDDAGIIDERKESFRKSYNAARREQMRKLGWQPLNSTSGNVSRYGGAMMLARADYQMAEMIEKGHKIEKAYGAGGCPCEGGGAGSGGGPGTGSGPGAGEGPGYPGRGKPGKGDPALAVYPEKAEQGETITLVANPAELAKGMPQKLDSDGKPVRSAYDGKSNKGKQEIAQVDFYRDVDGNGKLDTETDQHLASDADGKDGYSVEVSTAQFPPGKQTYFAKPEAAEGTGMKPTDLAKLAEELAAAAAQEKRIAQQTGEAAEASGVTEEQASGISDTQGTVKETADEAYNKLKPVLPEVADIVSDATKPIRAVDNLMKAAKTKPGEESKDKVESAAEKADAAAEQLAAAARKLRDMAKSGEGAKASGSPVSGQGEITSNEQLASGGPGEKAPGEGKPGEGPGEAAPGEGGPGKGGPGKGGGGDYGRGYDGGDVYYGNDDDVVVRDGDRVVYDDDDDVIVIDDDDDLVVIDDDDQVVIDRALGYIDDGDYDGAIVEYDRVIERHPDNVVVRSGRAGAYLAQGGYDYAIRDYDVLLQDQTIAVGQQVDFYYNRGCAHLAAGSLDAALSDFSMSIKLDEIGKSKYMAFNNRGIAYARQGKFESALADFNEAIEINANDALAYRNRALAYKKLGKTAEAEKDMAKVDDLSSL